MGPYTVFSLADIEKEARDIVESAQAKAKQMLQEAAAEAERIRQQARQEGYDAGKKQAREEELQLTIKEVAAARVVLEKAVTQIQQKKDELMRDTEKNLTRLAVEIAKSILKREVIVDSEAVLGPLKAALEASMKRGELLIQVHPDDADVVGKYVMKLGKTLPADVTVQVAGEEKVARGGCVIRFDAGMVRADIQDQLDKIEKILTGEQT